MMKLKPSDIFGLFVRIMGLLMAVGAIRSAHHWLRSTSALDAFLFGIPYLLITAYLLRGAPLLMRFSYPKNGAKETND